MALTSLTNLQPLHVHSVGISTFDGSVSVGGTLTYEDVTNVDAIGIITARSNIDCNGDLDVDGHTNLDNVSIAGVSTFSEKVLIGTTTAGYSTADDLTIATSGSTGITIRTGTTNQGNIYFADGTSGASQYAGLISYNHNTNHMFFGTNDGTERVRIDSSGRVGINCTPQEIFHVKGASETINSRDGVIFGSTDSLAADKGLPLVWTAHIGTDADYGIASICGRKENSTSDNGAGYLQFGTGNAPGAISEKLRIDSSGRLLVGAGAIANPKSSGAGSIDLDNQAFSIIVGGNHPSGGRSNNNAKTFRMSMVHYALAEEPINILQGYCDNSDNNVYIGGGTGSANSLTSVRIYTGANTTTTGGTERFRIHSAGQIGLSGANYGSSGQVLTSGGSGSAPTWSTISGTTINSNSDNRVITGSGTANTLNAESTFVHDPVNCDTQIVHNSNNVADLLVQNTSSGTGAVARLTLHGGSNANAGCQLGLIVGSHAWYLETPKNAGNLNFMKGAQKFRMGNDGNFTISDGNLVVASGHGIDFSATSDSGGGTMSSELLDDYEEGLWTPLIRNTSGSGTYGSDNVGSYTKIGNIVHISGTIHWTAMSGTTNWAGVIRNLPFASYSGTGYYRSACVVGAVSGITPNNSGDPNLCFIMDRAQGFLYIVGINASSGGFTHYPVISNAGSVYGFDLSYRVS